MRDLAVLVGVACWILSALAGADETARMPDRVEARSPTLLAVGIVRGDRMAIHVTRLLDNAPLRDATLGLLLRGTRHAAVAEPDGSYEVESKDLELPGPAAVVFDVVSDQERQELRGTLTIGGDGAKTNDPNSARQLWWWVLNFAVCIGFLKLWSMRRKTTAPED